MHMPFALAKTVGLDYRIDPEDTLKTKQAMKRLGFYTPPDWGLTEIADEAMIDGIKQFQKKNNLAADGLMKPGGPTERLIKTALWEQDNGAGGQAPVFRLAAAVGENSPNRPTDVRSAKRALTLAGHDSTSGAPVTEADNELSGNIRLLQREYQLKEDGVIAPDGQTEAALGRVAQPELVKSRSAKSKPSAPSAKQPPKDKAEDYLYSGTRMSTNWPIWNSASTKPKRCFAI